MIPESEINISPMYENVEFFIKNLLLYILFEFLKFQKSGKFTFFKDTKLQYGVN